MLSVGCKHLIYTNKRYHTWHEHEHFGFISYLQPFNLQINCIEGYQGRAQNTLQFLKTYKFTTFFKTFKNLLLYLSEERALHENDSKFGFLIILQHVSCFFSCYVAKTLQCSDVRSYYCQKRTHYLRTFQDAFSSSKG